MCVCGGGGGGGGGGCVCVGSEYNYLNISVCFFFRSIIYGIFSLTHHEEGVARWDPPHVSPRVKLCVHTKF